ncbi:ParB/RepB/Spo0J family partition protein [Zavarzinia aquatilis]|nr:ParB/RepB/Spo0J family partition protein [Zavarzinia aquatilis]
MTRKKPFIPAVATFDHFSHGAAVAAEAAPAHDVRMAPTDGQMIELRHDQIWPSSLNPRKHFDEEALAELAASIQTSGLLQNLVVRPIEGGRFELIAGERRWRAIGRLIAAGSWSEDTPIAARVVDAFDDHEARTLAIIENLQRKDIAPLEEGRAMLALKEGGMAVPDIAQAIGMSRRLVETRIALVTRLVPEAQAALDAGSINLNQARELLPATPEVQRALAKKLAAPDAPTYVTAVSAIRSEVRRELVPVERAIFDVEATGIEVVEDLDGQRMLPRAAFLAAQKAAVEARAEALKGQYASIVMVTWFYAFDWVTAEKIGRLPQEGAAVIVMAGDGTVSEHLGLFNRREVEAEENKEQMAAHQAANARAQASHSARMAAMAAFTTDLQAALRDDPTLGLAAMLALILVGEGNGMIALESALDDDVLAEFLDELGLDQNNELAPSIADVIAAGRRIGPEAMSRQVANVGSKLIACCRHWHPKADQDDIEIARELGVTIPEILLPTEEK